MGKTCEKCGKEYVTGLDEIKPGENQTSTTKVSVDVERTTGYNSTQIDSRYWQEKNLCPDCANDLWDKLYHTYMEFKFGKKEAS